MSTNAREEKVLIFSWGANSYGELGHGHTEDLLSPVLMREESCGVAIAAGGGHSFIYHPFSATDQAKHSAVKGSGWNTKGQLGLPAADQTVQGPQEIPALNNLNIVKMVCGWDFTLCLTVEGRLYSFGSNAFGQLGIGDVDLPNKNFTAEPMPVGLSERVLDMAAGLRHAAAITDSDKLFTWGAGKKGQLGISLEKPTSTIIEPTEVNLPGKPVKVVAGAYHTSVLSSDGDVYVMGDNKRAQLAIHPNTVKSVSEPHKIPRSLFNEERVTNIWSGWTHLLAKTESKSLYTWGRSDYGQLGRATVSGYDPNPGIVEEARDCMNISCGSEHNLALLKDRRVITWGWNEHGICGTGDEKHVLVPHQMDSSFSGKALSVNCGMGQSFVISTP